MNNEWNVPCIWRNARPNNNQLITYYLPLCYLLRIQQYPLNTSYKKGFSKKINKNSWKDVVKNVYWGSGIAQGVNTGSLLGGL